MEFTSSNVQHNGCLPDSARTSARTKALRPLPFRVCSEFHRTRPSQWLLDVAVCAVEAARAGRHRVHCAAEAAAHLPALVPPHHGADVQLVQLHRVHRVGPLVHRDELLRPLGDVLVLCAARPQL
uniref:(northern house mosquito) hypothetical protein n=1 Tax=Culex pipiens TaxID=7175 RepID=A0A8D8KDV4_CULPI